MTDYGVRLVSTAQRLCCAALCCSGGSVEMYIIPELTQKTNSSDCRDAAEFVSAAGLHVAGASAGTTPALIQLRTDSTLIHRVGVVFCYSLN
ncbi:hypothetical protein ABVT39_007807, partial [Epinephelus coioides]